MARGTDFGGIHSYRDLHLIQASVAVDPAKPKTNFINIPGADGAKDFSEAPAGRVVFNTRKITWIYKLYPGDNWATKYAQVSNAINGRSCRITLDDDPDYYYPGRVSVDKHAADGILHTITVTATCQPYKLRQEVTRSVINLAVDVPKVVDFVGERMEVIPVITVTTEVSLQWKGNSYSLSAGTHKILDIQFTEGVNRLQALTTTEAGTLTVEYQKGAL